MAYENEIREILLRDWDPFCVGDNPNLKDEYDSFIVEIASRLQAGQSVEQIHDYLVNVEKELQAPIADPQRMKTATALRRVIV